MKSKRPILLYCPDVHLVSATAYALRLHPYDVAAFSNTAEVIAAIDRTPSLACIVLIHAQAGDLTGRLIHRILEAPVDVPLLLVDRVGDLAPVRYAAMVLYGHNTSMSHLLSALETLCEGRHETRPRSKA